MRLGLVWQEAPFIRSVAFSEVGQHYLDSVSTTLAVFPSVTFPFFLKSCMQIYATDGQIELKYVVRKRLRISEAVKEYQNLDVSYLSLRYNPPPRKIPTSSNVRSLPNAWDYNCSAPGEYKNEYIVCGVR
jgi:hypothetical protein